MAKNNPPGPGPSPVDVDALLTQTINLFDSGITNCDINVAIANVTAWIDFLKDDDSPVAPTIGEMLGSLLGHLNTLNPPQISQDIANLSGPTVGAGDPTAPTASRPKQISRLGILLCGG